MIDIQTKEELKYFFERNYVKNRVQFSIRHNPDSKPKNSQATTLPAGYNTDVVIAFCLTKQIYDIMLVNELLQEYANTSL